MRRRVVICALVLCVGLAVVAPGAARAADCVDRVGRLESIEGVVELRSAAGGWRPAAVGDGLCGGDQVRVGERSRAAATLGNDNKVRLDERTLLRLVPTGARAEIDTRPAAAAGDRPAARTLLEMLTGAAYFFSRWRQSLDVTTPVVNAAVEGTEFLIRVTAAETLVGVVEGQIVAGNAFGAVTLGAGEAAVATEAAAPRSFLLVRPLDAVAWALHYPSIITDPGGVDPALAEAASLLAVGRVAAATALVDGVLAAAGAGPGSPTAATLAVAHGLKAVMAIAANANDAGLAAAEAAVAADATSAPAWLALSFAEQARFRIAAARAAAERATAVAPTDALAWARLAELWLMEGWRDRSQDAAARAVALAPDLERAISVDGFAALSAFDLNRARLAFETAVFVAPADPQARLGLGLTKIRAGALAAGRADLELAVLLDPNNALLRSYLGKAYFEEKREALAGDQFGLAQQLDPRDPTAFFYDAILLQTQNRPVAALAQLEESIRLNDDRAVYRSRELLDSDRAARGAALGRIYDDLGFQQLGINAATRSLAFDPASASAHRFLSDIYVTEPRREIARVSELLQAQLLQDVNINPVQPSLAVTDFNIITTGGPARPGFNEFNPLFEGNQARLNLTGLAGNNATYGNEAVVSGLYNRYSISVGQFHYQTNGFRDNNGVEADVYNIFAQAAISPDFNIQTELRREKNDSEFVPILFDPDIFFNDQLSSRQNSARVGGRYNLSPNSLLIGSFIFSDGDFDDKFDGGGSIKDDIKGMQGELGHFYTGNRYNIVSGSSIFYASTDRTAQFPSDVDALEPNPFETPQTEDFDANQQSGYVYSQFKPVPELLATLGVSVDHFSQGKYDLHKVNPKLGLQWELAPDVVFRAAAFRVLKPRFVTNRTIQPTQVAGFNQFFDDPDGTESWRFGGAVDLGLGKQVSGGIEGSARYLQENLRRSFGDLRGLGDAIEQRREQLYRGYLYWTPHEEWALSTQLVFDKYNSEESVFTSPVAPQKVATWSVPLSLRYFHPWGFFSTLTGTFVQQDVQYRGDGGNAEGDSQFVLLDASVGYRLPQRLGLVSLQGINLLNNGFKYQDDSYRQFTADPVVSRFVPDRTIVGRVTLNF